MAQSQEEEMGPFDIARAIGVRTNESQKIDDKNFFEAPRITDSYPTVDSSELLDHVFQHNDDKEVKLPVSAQYADVKIEVDDHGVITNMEILSSPFKSNTQNLINDLSKITLLPAKMNGKAVGCVGIMRKGFKEKQPVKTDSHDFGLIYWIIPDLNN